MTEEQYAKQLDEILANLPRDKNKSGNPEYVQESDLAKELSIDEFYLQALLHDLEKKGFIERYRAFPPFSLSISSPGFVFSKSGGFIRELKDQRAKQRTVQFSAWAAGGSAIAAVALFFLTALQVGLAYDANSEKVSEESKIQRTEERLQVLESRVDSLRVLISSFPVNKPDTLLYRKPD